jgi:hypothetical protein
MIPAIIAIVVTVASTVVAARAQRQQVKAQEEMNNYNASLAEQEALVRERDSRIAANAQREEAARALSRQRALYAAAGVDAAEGTPLMVMAQQASEFELAAQETTRTGNIQAGQLRSQAALDRMAGNVAVKAGKLNSTASLLQGASQAAGAYGSYLQRNPTVT